VLVKAIQSAWFDHQWGDMSSIVQLGWDWFALQLDDNSESMLFVVRDPSRQVLVGGSASRADGVSSQIAANELTVTPIGQWTSPHTGCTYPSGWNIQVREKSFTVTPVLPDQELSTATPVYWEGPCTVAGTVAGRAYVELTGYCR
jgi:predicted secreted hydrolase